MLITNQELLRMCNNAQATYESVFPNEDGNGFSVKFEKLGVEYVFIAEITQEHPEDLTMRVPRGLVRNEHVTRFSVRSRGWMPCGNMRLMGWEEGDNLIFLQGLNVPHEPAEETVALVLHNLSSNSLSSWVEPSY